MKYIRSLLGFLVLAAILSACNFPALTTSKSAKSPPQPTPPAAAGSEPTAIPVTANPTPEAGVVAIPTPTPLEAAFPPAAPTAMPAAPPVTPTAIVLGAAPTATAIVQASPIPTSGSYTLKRGEFPWCIARRFNLHPVELLAANGLVRGQLFYAGLVLKLPSTGNPFPGPRALRPHPATFTIVEKGWTLRHVACYFGDLDPDALAAANGISPDEVLPPGRVVKIP